MRGSRDFSDRREYENFLKKTFTQLNAGRVKRFEEELEVLKPLPGIRLNDYAREDVKVSRGSTVHVRHNIYSVDSRLIGEWVRAYIYAEKIQIWYSQRLIETIPRLRGEKKHRIQYRHIIDWLVRKPGAFENYRFRSDLFPSSHFRMAYDELREHSPTRASKEYLKILYLAAKEGEEHIESALRHLLGQEEKLSAEAVERIVKSGQQTSRPSPTEVVVDEVDLTAYDELLSAGREEELVYA
jgi:hypothetical protein